MSEYTVISEKTFLEKVNHYTKKMILRTTVAIPLTIVLILFVLGVLAQEPPLNLDGLDDVISATAPATPVSATEPDKNTVISDSDSVQKKQSSFWDLIIASGLIGYVIILLSLVAVALMIEYALTIRRNILIPAGFAEEILKRISQGQWASAVQKCQSDSSVLAQILYAGMKEYEFGWSAVEKSVEETTAEQASRFYRKIEYLNVIGNITPMLGLLGTVIGMVVAFQRLAESEGYARAADLAGGIYLALVTTVEGLLVAIPCLAAYSFFSNRIASLISETTFIAEQVLLPLKKIFAAKNKINKTDVSGNG
jgi:biopolymer transport protein ExbB